MEFELKHLWSLLVLVVWSLQCAHGQKQKTVAASDDKANLLYLFDRPGEPIFVPKGDNRVVFKIPNEYLVNRYQTLGTDLLDRFGSDAEQEIAVPRISVPDLTIPMQLGRRENFSPFIPFHRRLARRLIDIFMGMRTYDDFLSASVYCHDRINPYMYIYALSVAILHRPDTTMLPLPSLAEVFPDKYIDSRVISSIREESNVVTQSGSRVPLEIPLDYSASDLEVEHRVAYFREDIGINLHHWHWHLVYPSAASRNIVVKDRRGELFYYMHQQIVARYNFEHLSNRLERVKRFINWREPIEEGYFSKLDSLVASRVWPPRPAGAKLSDINREADQLKFDIQDLERWRDRIFEAIHLGHLKNERGQNVELTEQAGIDLLGNVVESSILSVNPNLYGDLHNLGHAAIALCHDPDGRHLETFSIMGDPATDMRDPIFYRWHAMVDDIFQEHKNALPRYTAQQLGFDGIRVSDMEVQSQGAGRNLFSTFWQQNDVDLSRGLDFAPRGPVFARFTHLQHAPFMYRIQVENGGQPRMGTVRIFMAPRFDERGLPLLFRDQKLLFIELDKFQFNLRSGRNVIERLSTQSSMTIPFEQTFRRLRQDQLMGGPLADFNYCGCGWPQHMLIPKGSPEGFASQLFVMVSNYADDMVEQQERPGCRHSSSYCGVRNQLYPDRRSMGYPFDRMPRDNVNTLQEFLTPNMFVQNVIIRFSNIVQPPAWGRNATTSAPTQPLRG